MNRIIKFLAAVAVMIPLATIALRADDSDNGEARLRQTLKDTLLQLRQAQSDLANLQAAQASQADEGKALKDQIELLTKHSADDRTESAKAADAIEAKLVAQTAENARIEDLLAQWKAAAEKLSKAAREAEVQKTKALADAALLQRQAEDLKSKNEELYRIASEILGRYEKYGLGDQFLAKEPFIGRARADLETQIQDYDDQIQAEKGPP
jgi:chromosome segregation ATPase